MIIIKQNNITIPRGISPSFITTDHDISLQKKSVTITKNGVSTITPDPSYDALSSVRVTTDIHPTPKLQNIIKTYVENGNYRLAPGTSYDGIGNVSITIDVPEKVFKTQDKNENIVSNGDYRYTADERFDGLKSVNVHVEVPEKKIILQNKDITENGSVTYDEGFDGLGTVNVNVPIPEYKSQTKDVSYVNNGSFTLKPDIDFDGISQANITVNIPEKNYKTQEKTAVPTTSEQRIIPDSSFDALSAVNISAVDSTIDSNIIPTNIKKGVSILGVEGTLETGTSTNYVPLKYIEYSDNVFYRLLNDNVNLARNFKLKLTYSKSNPYGYPISINNDTQQLFEIFDQANLSTTSTLRYYDPDNDKSQIFNVDTDYKENRLIDYSFIHFKKSSTLDYYGNEVILDFTDSYNVESNDYVYTKYGNNMYAFARYLNGVLTPAGSTGLRIYQIQVMYHIDNLASSLPLMANFIPVIYNGQAGFLETNTNVFSANLGTGTPKYEIL